MNPARRDLLRIGTLGITGAALPSLAAASQAPASPAGSQSIFNIRNYGATGDGKTLDTPAINRAIEAAAAAGGGTVVFPAGIYLCFSIHLKSNVHLYLDARRHHPRRRLASARRHHRLQRRRLRSRRAQHRLGRLSGLRPQSLAQLALLGRRPPRHHHHRPRPHLRKRPQLRRRSRAVSLHHAARLRH